MLDRRLSLTLRSLIKQGRFTLIHLIGLSLGLTCCLLVYVFIQYELSFDQYHEKAEQIYRINIHNQSENGIDYSIGTPYPLLEALKTELLSFATIARVHNQGDGLIEVPSNDLQKIDDILFVDPAYFDLFDHELLDGTLKEKMSEPNQVLLSKSTAYLLFGDENPIGKQIKLDNLIDANVAGIIEDVPVNSHLPANMLFSMESLTRDLVGGLPFDSWGTTIGNVTYVEVSEETNPSQYKEALSSLVSKYMSDGNGPNRIELVLQPLSDIHFNTNYATDLVKVTPIPIFYLWLFGSIAFFILIIACFNFINLSTAQAIERAREVGVRKVLGANRSELILQFMGEAFLICTVAGCLSTMMSYLVLPSINELLNKSIPQNYLYQSFTFGFLMISVMAVSVTAGLYPAIGLANFQPVQTLSSKNTAGDNQHLGLRKTLVVGQFVITLILLIATITILRQVDFMKHKDLGFDQSTVLMASIPNQQGLDQLRYEILKNPGIEKVSFCIGAPTSINANISTSFIPHGEHTGEEDYKNSLKAVDYHYLKTFGLELVEGRWFTEAEGRRADLGLPKEERNFKFVVNEQLTRHLGYTDPVDVIGKQLQVSVQRTTAEVIGVVKDFNMSSLKNAVEPTILMNLPQLYYNVGIKIKAEQVATTINHLKEVWAEKYPEYLFDYEFLDERIANLYESETRLFYLFQFIAGLAILISCLGLLGLISFITKQRTKELGIRKVLGASPLGLVGLLSKDFLKLVVIATLIASPIAYYFMNQWLQNFAFRVQIQWWIFLVAAVGLIFLTLATIGLQSIKVVYTNPVNSLRQD